MHIFRKVLLTYFEGYIKIKYELKIRIIIQTIKIKLFFRIENEDFLERRSLMISTKDAFIDAKEVSQVLGVGMTKAYAVIKAYNAELDARGYYTMRGKCPRKYFEQKIYGYADCYNPNDDLAKKTIMVAEESHYDTKNKTLSE